MDPKTFFRTARMDAKLVMVFVVIGLLPLVVAGVLALRYANRTVRQQVMSKLQIVADSKAQRIETYLLTREQYVGVVARSRTALSLVQQLDAVFHETGIQSPAYAALALEARDYFVRSANPNHEDNVLLVAADGHVVFSLLPGDKLGTNLRAAAHQNTALAKAFANVSRLLVGNIISDDEPAAASGTHQIFVSAPMVQNGVLVGVMVFHLNNRELFEIAGDYAGLGETGETFIGRREGDSVLFLVPTRHDPDAAFRRRITLGSPLGMPAQVAVDGDAGLGEAVDYRGVDVLAAWKYLPTLHSGLVVKLDAAEAFKPVYGLRRAAAGRGLLFILLIILLAPRVARYLAAPIRELAQTTRAFSAGDLTRRARIGSSDELGDMAVAFNQMADTIQRQIGAWSESGRDLEQRVEARTVDLAMANLALELEAAEHQRTAATVRENESYFHFLNDLGNATRPLTDPGQIMAETARMLGGHLRASRCAYADVEADGERFTILHDYTDGCASTVGRYGLSLFGSRAVARLNHGETLIIRHVSAELLPDDGADMFKAIGIQAIITCPLIKAGALRAMMAVHQTTPRDWTLREIALVQEVVERCWATIERRTAQENLRRSEALLRIAGRAARLGGWTVDLPELRLTWSDEVCAIHDVASGFVPGLDQALDFYAPSSREVVGQAFAACVELGTPFDLELEIVTAQGRRVAVRSIGEAQRNALGAIVRVQGALQDITERKRVDAKLTEASGLLDAMLQNSPDLIYFKDRASRYVRFSNPCFTSFGLTDPEMLRGKTDADFFVSGQGATSYADEQQIIRTGQPILDQLEKVAYADGRTTWLLTTKMPWRDGSGAIVGTFGISKDVSAVKEAEGTIAYERDRFRALLDSSPDTIYFKDAQSRFVVASRSKVRKTLQCVADIGALRGARGLPADVPETEMLTGLTDFDTYREADARLAFDDEQKIVRTGEALIGKLEKQTLLDGAVHWALTSKIPWRDREGKIVGTFGISKDITDLKEAEEKLAQVNRELQASSRQAGMAEVATSVLHNVGNVLNSVNVSATLVADRVRHSQTAKLAKLAVLFDEHQADLASFLTTDARGRMIPGYFGTLVESLAEEREVIVAELDELRKNIGHITEIVAMQQSHAKNSGIIESVPLVDIVEDVLRMNSTALTRNGVEIVRDFRVQPTLSTDRHKVMQILVNVVRNATFACVESGRVDRQIIVRLSGDGPGFQITVIDNGNGIPAENLTRIFNHGFTTKKGGHGFGLHSGALAAKQLGGSLSVRSAGAGQGATFTLELPRPLAGADT